MDLNTIAPLGRRVVSVGRTRGVQRGTIVAFRYEGYDEPESIYTHYLIIGEEGEVFLDHGDSGKLTRRRKFSGSGWGRGATPGEAGSHLPTPVVVGTRRDWTNGSGEE